jgi:hypothetical protein
MPQYRYIGGATSYIGDTKLDHYGQSVELDEQMAFMAMEGGCALLTAEHFDEFGFTPEELAAYKEPGSDWNAPAEFKAKKRAALIAYQTRPEKTEESK